MNKKIYEKIKRVMDIFISILALLFSFPILAVVSLAISIEDGWPIIYFHPRVGKNRKLFNFYKFRSMVKNADQILFNDPKMYQQMRSGSNKIVNDPRITKIGRFIRKYSIDEMPQFINILKGEMSFVGPRAYRPDELKKYEMERPDMKPFLEQIISINPGLTGFWQVSGRSKISFDERIKMEATYSQKNSIFFDIYIIIKTPLAVLKADGAY